MPLSFSPKALIPTIARSSLVLLLSFPLPSSFEHLNLSLSNGMVWLFFISKPIFLLFSASRRFSLPWPRSPAPSQQPLKLPLFVACHNSHWRWRRGAGEPQTRGDSSALCQGEEERGGKKEAREQNSPRALLLSLLPGSFSGTVPHVPHLSAQHGANSWRRGVSPEPQLSPCRAAPLLRLASLPCPCPLSLPWWLLRGVESPARSGCWVH